MEKMIRGYVFRLYPTMEQKILIEKSFGCYRYVYNYFLSKANCKGYINKFDCIKELSLLSSTNEWLKEVDSCLLRCSIFSLEDALTAYKKGTSPYPKYKSKTRSRNSYRTSNFTREYKEKVYNSISINLKDRTITLPKLKEVKIRGYRNLQKIDGKIINATIYKEASKYYVSLCVEEYREIEKQPIRKVVGIDLGIKELLTTSDGIVIKNNRYIEKYEQKIKGLNKWLARTKKGSKNREKVKKKLAEVYRKLKNARKYFLHETSKRIVEENDLIVTEKLKINQMVQNKHLSKRIYDASWYELIRELTYKSKWKGKACIQIDTYYPSSQECERCGYINKEVKDLNIRKWECDNCHNENERDINASINIMWKGLRKYVGSAEMHEMKVK